MFRVIDKKIPWLWSEGERQACPIAEEVSVLFEEYRGPVLRYVLSLGLSLQDGEDVLQEVFLGLFHHLKKGRPKDNLRGWVFRVGHNQALKRRRELRVGTVELPVLADPAANPEQQMVERLRQEKMLQVVAALPERDRWCLYLRAEGLRYREIAATLGISLGTVASTLSRALERLGRVEAL